MRLKKFKQNKMRPKKHKIMLILSKTLERNKKIKSQNKMSKICQYKIMMMMSWKSKMILFKMVLLTTN